MPIYFLHGTGAGAVADAGSRVNIRHSLYVDDYFATEYTGVKRNPSKTFTLGQGQVDQGMERAVQGMKVGGKRRVMIREEVAPELSKELGGIQLHSVLAIEIDLIEVE